MVRRRKPVDLVLPLTSFGDIAFLMIIFFMLVSNFMKNANMEMTPAQSESIDKQDTPQVVVTLDQDATLWYEGNQVTTTELLSLLQMRADDLRDDPVHVNIHAELLRPDYMPVIEVVSEAGLKMILTGELEN